MNKARSHNVVPGSDLTRLRVALTVFFALDGFVFAGWVVRIPAIKEQTHASATELGFALLGVSAGAVITMMLTGRLCRRYGSHPVTVACAVLLSLGVALPPLTHSLLGSLAPSVWATLIGFAVTGLGLPISSRSPWNGPVPWPAPPASRSPPPWATAACSSGRPRSGFMADWFSLPTALTSVAALAALIGVITRRAASG